MELTRSSEIHLLNYFKEVEGLTALQAKVKGATKQKWNRIVDGRKFYAVVLKVASEDEVWSAFQCFQLKSTHSMY